MRFTTAPAARGSVERVLEHRVRERCLEWFPDLAGTPGVRLRRLGDRPRSTLYLLELENDGESRRVVAKVRKATPADGAPRGVRRPRLAADPLPAPELTELEYTGLRYIHEALGAGSAFGAVRPLDHLPDENAILMDWVPGVSLRRILTAQSRIAPITIGRTGRASSQAPVWRHAGAWLRAFQEAVPHETLPHRTTTAPEVVQQFEAFGDFLSGRRGLSRAATLAELGARLAARVLPAQLESAAGHGDYAPRNVLVGSDGRLTVVDPLPRWSVPRHEDLCRFLVGIRLVGLQVHSHGLAYGRRWVEDVEDAVIRGYFGDEQAPVAQLRCYQLLIMLDKWSALVADGGGGWRNRVLTRSAARATGYLHTEGRVLLELAAATAP